VRAILVLAFVAMIPLAASSAAQVPPPAAQVHGRLIAGQVKKLLDANYVLPEARPKFDAVLDKNLAAGRYDTADPNELVNRINEDLRSVTPDKHLHVMYDPETSKALAAAPPDAGADDAPPTAEDIANAIRRNSGLVQMRILPGNIRYLETDGFMWAGEVTERAYDDAMRFLSGGDAVIIDMRRNGGGDPYAVRYLVSHFLAPNTPLMTFYMGSKGVSTTAALAKTIAPRMVGKPLYVLTSAGTASAAEEFTGHIAGYKLGGSGFSQRILPASRRHGDQHFGWPSDPRIYRQGLGRSRFRTEHRGPSRQCAGRCPGARLEAVGLDRFARQAPVVGSCGSDAHGQDDAGEDCTSCRSLCGRLRRKDRAA